MAAHIFRLADPVPASLCQVHKKKLGLEAIATMMAEADTDKDGEVDLEEFKLIMRGAPKAENCLLYTSPSPRD